LAWSYGLHHLRGVSAAGNHLAIPKNFADIFGRTASLKSSSSVMVRADKIDASQICFDFGTRNPKSPDGKSNPIKVSLGNDVVLSAVHILLNLIDAANRHPELVPKPSSTRVAKSSGQMERSFSSPETLSSAANLSNEPSAPPISVLSNSLPSSSSLGSMASFELPPYPRSPTSPDEESSSSGQVSPKSPQKGRNRSYTSPEGDKHFVWDKNVLAKRQTAAFVPKSSSSLKNSIVPDETSSGIMSAVSDKREKMDTK
jgi:hypothetical protein